MRVEGKFRSFDGTSIAYRTYGEPGATPLVFCSGIACDEVYWTPIAPEIEGDRQVITWDYPHHGDSEPAQDPTEIRVDSLSRHAEALTQHLGIDSAAFAGHSMGVQVALDVYRRSPRLVKGLIAIAGPYAHTVGHLYGTGIGLLMLAGFERIGRFSPALLGSIWRAAVDPRFADPLGRAGGLIGHAPSIYMRRYFEHLGRSDPMALIAMFRAGHSHDASSVLPSIKAPMLILHGTADVMTPLSLARKMCEAVPDCELIAIDGGAHTLPVEDPDMIVFEVRRFLQLRVDQRNTLAKNALIRS